MAAGRFLSRAISQNEQLAQVSLPAALLFTWCISHLDREGRITGNPALLKSNVCPLRPEITAESIPHLLEELRHALDHEGRPLVTWYSVRGTQVLAFPGFGEQQKGLRKDREAESRLPAPDHPNAQPVAAPSGPVPDPIRSGSGPAPAEVEVQEEGEVQEEVPDSTNPGGTAPGVNDDLWAAGFIEGEGTFTNPYPSSPSGRRGARVSANQTTREPLERLQRALGGTIYDHTEKHGRFQWLINGEAAIAIMERLAPHMSTRRQGQIRRAIEASGIVSPALTDETGGDAPVDESIDQTAEPELNELRGEAAALIRKHLWLGTKPPQPGGMGKWTMARDLSVWNELVKKGEAPGHVNGAIEYARSALRFGERVPLTMLVFRGEQGWPRFVQAKAAYLRDQLRRTSRGPASAGDILDRVVNQ